MNRTTNNIRGGRSVLCLVASSLLAAACGSRAEQTSAEQTSDGPQFTDLSVSELRGGQSGVEGGCHDPSPVVGEVALDDDVGGFTPSDVLVYAIGEHIAEIRWRTLAPPAAAGASESMTVELELTGAPRWFQSSCGSYLELPVHYHLFSSDGSIDVEATNTLVSTDGHSAHLSNVDQFPLNQDWTTRMESVLNTTGSEVLELSLTLDASGMRGGVSARGDGLCSLVEWPLTECRVGVGDTVHGERVEELLEHLDGNSVQWSAPDFHWNDDSVTELTVDVAFHASQACVGYEGVGEEILRNIQLPVELRVSSADGRVNALLPGWINTAVNGSAQWSRLSFGAEVTAPPDTLGSFDVAEFAGDERVVLRLSGDLESVALNIESLTPASEHLQDTNVSCASAPWREDGVAPAGVTTPVLSGSWDDE